MPNRYLKESICTSDNLNRLPMETVACWMYLLPATDDYGRVDARPEIVKGRCFPLRPEITPEIIEIRLHELQAANLLKLYEIEGRRYLQFSNWERHNRLRAKTSRYPGMDTNGVTMISHDNTCRQMLSDDCLKEVELKEVEENKNVENLLLPPEEKPRESTSKVIDLPPEALRLAGLLADGILKNNPRHRELTDGKREKCITAWAADVDKLLRIDKQPVSDVERVILFSQADGFWNKNILSGAKLRKQWDQLFIKAVNAPADSGKLDLRGVR